MPSVFDLRNGIVDDYQNFSRSFSKIEAEDISRKVAEEYGKGRYWPDAMLQINPHYKTQVTIQDYILDGTLHPDCAKVFRYKDADGEFRPIKLFAHQAQAISLAQSRKSFIVTTGTGSGKSLSFFIPIVSRVLQNKGAEGRDPLNRTSAIVIYPMNALANSQMEELEKYLGESRLVTFRRYTGQESEEDRKKIADSPPDILLTNYMMLELILTRYDEGEGASNKDRKIIEHCRGLEFLVLDELHTYRGRQGADVAMLVRRIRALLGAPDMICIGTSATMKSQSQRDDVTATPEEAASKLFGEPITKEEVVGETLKRVTKETLSIDYAKAALADDVKSGRRRWDEPGYDYEKFSSDPMAVWVELTLGIEMAAGELAPRPERARPKTLNDAADALAQVTGESHETAEERLRSFLIAAQKVETPDKKPPFAFKLHQFISGPGRVSCTLEPEGIRTVTLDEQVYAPLDGARHAGDEKIPLFYTYFCRECGQEYHPVWCTEEKDVRKFERREIDDVPGKDSSLAYGFLAPVKAGQRFTGSEGDLPDEWFEYKNGVLKLKTSYRKKVPEEVGLDKYGVCTAGGAPFWYMRERFGYCVRCGTSHDLRRRDANQLAGLSGEGRSSATSVLTLATMRELQKGRQLSPGGGAAQKLLGFVDNRQDAALQAGHFNDFMFNLLLRGGLLSAIDAHGGMLPERELTEAVFSALGFDVNEENVNVEYMRTPQTNVRGHELAKNALCRVLGYRLLQDQRTDWRYSFPNMEKLGLIEVDYDGLKAFCADEDIFIGCTETLGGLTPEVREFLFRFTFDHMRHKLCIDSPFLGLTEIEKTKRESAEHLVWPWSLEDEESTQSACSLTFDTVQSKGKSKQNADLVSAGPGSTLIRGIKSAIRQRDGIVPLVQDMLKLAVRHNYVQTLSLDKSAVGYRLKPSCLEWKKSGTPQRANRYFSALYENIAAALRSHPAALLRLEAHEHTAQVDSDTRRDLELRFRNGEREREAWKERHPSEPFMALPVLYCSPTMELGVDISALDAVYMRNVPPTPANYAQRSGRAGRAGQAALILTYCAAQSPHDQWYFKNEADIVQGVVRPPAIDLTNRDLVDSHFLAVWLSCVRYPLGSNIAPLIDLNNLPLRPVKQEIMERCTDAETRDEALRLIHRVEGFLTAELASAPWYSKEYAERLVAEAPARFNRAFDRWRDLLSATELQIKKEREIIDSFSSSFQETKDAQLRQYSAENQLRLLTSMTSQGGRAGKGGQKGANSQSLSSDFYVYRYLANQGFLPGYNFPRLPLMAWIPDGRGRGGAEKEGRMVSRPRFLAISEFGPRSLLYHEGNTFRVVRAKLNAGMAGEDAPLGTVSARVCPSCGYCHSGESAAPEPTQNVCEHCGGLLSDSGRIGDLYRIETVETERVERITANDEERKRQGFELQTTYRGTQAEQAAEVVCGGELCASLSWFPSARLWRINKGWRRRKNKNQLGFFINPMTGRWSKEDSPDELTDDEAEDKASNKTPPQHIVPYVEDHKNIVTLKPARELSPKAFATVQAALEAGMERVFQIENSELAVEPLPNADERRVFLFYESAEGGAGVLQNLREKPGAMALVARNALEIMHYKVPDGAFTRDSLEEGDKGANCVAGCYSCLLSYYNQTEHDLIDRKNAEALDFLAALANSEVHPVGTGAEEKDAGEDGSPLSRWTQLLRARSCNMPDELSKKTKVGTIDAYYKDARTAVFIGSVGEDVRSYLRDKGLRVVLFPYDEDGWEDVLSGHREVFYSKIDEGSDEL
ncbi:MAG: DEAD/DEAH box helicase [Synergistaceae bacterium]|jgi:hypothetical protein|nr:DEAD/DEAH box helicase [Synergistaceae bacterium]